jgi:gliding motility-associated-like protein
VIDTSINLIKNGNFESGNTDFYSAYNYMNTGQLIEERTYTVDKNPSDWHYNWSSCNDHTFHNGQGNMMIVNGDSIKNTIVWEEMIANIQPNAEYIFSAYLQNILYLPYGDPAKWTELQFSINNNPIGDVLEARTQDTCNWKLCYVRWKSENNTSATISVINQHYVEKNGNDFALDDISFAPPVALRDTFVVVVNPFPTDNLGPDRAVPYDGSITLDAGNPGASYLWLPSGETTQTITISNITIPETITVTVDQSGCERTFEINIGAECTEILVPNVFTPDKPPNNRIDVQGSGINDLDFMIFNRQGEMVFHSKDQGTGWDGTFKGIAQPMDVYMYYLKVQCLSGGTIEKKGSITLIR